ncbi:MAG: hypothetical protein IPH77_17520 [Ignavibacteria bacterium]|nr:hypothetical protein [Ignavibacteria bacterium]
MLPNANFATPQVFKVIASITPTPVIAWTDPLATTSIIAGITTFTRCIPSAVTIPLSVNGLPAGSTTTYQWYNAITNLPIPGANGSTYTISAVGNYSVYVYTTTTSSPYIAPGCRVKSKKVNVIINNCPCTPLQCSNASLMGVSVATRINSGGSWPTLNTVVGSGLNYRVVDLLLEWRVLSQDGILILTLILFTLLVYKMLHTEVHFSILAI